MVFALAHTPLLKSVHFGFWSLPHVMLVFAHSYFVTQLLLRDPNNFRSSGEGPRKKNPEEHPAVHWHHRLLLRRTAEASRFPVGFKTHSWYLQHHQSRWCFQIYFLFSPLLGEDFQFDEYFSDELKPPTRPVFEWLLFFHLFPSI